VKRNDLLIILALEMIVIGVVTALFQLIPLKVYAAIAASVVFIAMGIFINIAALRWNEFYKSATFWVAQAHLFFSAIPLLVYRLLNFNTGFDQIQIFGIPGPEFHEIATRIYVVLLAATLLDLVRVTLRKRRTKEQTAATVK
jgi:hypothetical protein